MELIRNRNFTLTTGSGEQSKLRRLKNGVPLGSVLAPLLFNTRIYTSTFVFIHLPVNYIRIYTPASDSWQKIYLC